MVVKLSKPIPSPSSLSLSLSFFLSFFLSFLLSSFLYTKIHTQRLFVRMRKLHQNISAILYPNFAYLHMYSFPLCLFSKVACALSSVCIMTYCIYFLFSYSWRFISFSTFLHYKQYWSENPGPLLHIVLPSPPKPVRINGETIRENNSTEQGGQLQSEYIKISSFSNIPTGIDEKF